LSNISSIFVMPMAGKDLSNNWKKYVSKEP
jgi:hypothetical protein